MIVTYEKGTSLMVVKRNGEVVHFDPSKIKNAISKAIKAVGEKIPIEVLDTLESNITEEIKSRFIDFFPNVENIQDIVEKHLVKQGLYEIAKAYILYRAQRNKVRELEKEQTIEKAKLGRLTVKKRNGKLALFDIKKLNQVIYRLSREFENEIDVDLVSKEVLKNIYDGVKSDEIEKALVLASISLIELDPVYDHLSARLFLQKLYKEVIGMSLNNETFEVAYRNAFVNGIKKGVENNLFDKRMLDFDLEVLSNGMILERDDIFRYMGIQTIYERYLTKLDDGLRLELPQAFWMRVAMGLALNEPDKNKRALEFYELLSSMRFINSTPTLFNSGTTHPQLSSCYLTTVKDDLTHIFKCISDNAQMSKWAGGLGNDWSNIRSTGSLIKTTQAESQGVIPFLKIANDVTAAIARTGKRRGGTCAYLETWHLDIESFLDLRKNTGDDRRRTHDMNTANWIPDLFMKRVINDDIWTLFSPEEAPELHHLYGKKFEEKYLEYEQKAKNGVLKKYKIVSASRLWKKMLGMLFETGHPWITFKDPCNIRSPQDHIGVIHSSNLCTEITLNTSEDETAVCNLGSISLEKHIINGKLDYELVEETVKTAIRMLDNVIDLNFYPTKEGRNSNIKHRPLGLGIMGFQDTLFLLDINFDSQEAIKFADESMELISYYAILTSSELAKEKGVYESYKGSKWDKGIFPIDTIDLLEEERNMKIELDRKEKLDWSKVREHVKQYGMRNSNVMAVAPTATISNIANCYPCIEPIYKNIYVKANISGEFTVVNSYLIQDLKKLNLWNRDMLDQIKYYDGNLKLIGSIPQNIKDKYKEAFEIDPIHSIDITAARGKWIDQSQSHNVFSNGNSGKKLSEVYLHAWKKGLKTTYYLRTLAATQIEKSTLDASKFGYTQQRDYKSLDNKKEEENNVIIISQGKTCSILDPDCESCQ